MISSSSNAQQLQVAQTQESAYTRVTAPLVQTKTSAVPLSLTKNSPSPPQTDVRKAASPPADESGTGASQTSKLATNTPTKSAQPTTTQATKSQQAKPMDYTLPEKKTDTVQLSATAQAEALHQLGFTVSEIANRLGVSATAVDGYLKINPDANTSNLAFTASASSNSSNGVQGYTASGSSNY